MLGRALDFDNAAVGGEDEIGVRLGVRILVVIEIADRHVFIEPATDRGDLVAQRKGRQHALLNEAGGNSKLSLHLTQVYRQIRRYNLIAMSFREGMVDSMESHRRILAAIEAGDAAAAERELAGHGRLSYQVLRSNFKKLRRAFRPEAHPPRRNGKGRDRNGAGGRPSGG